MGKNPGPPQQQRSSKRLKLKREALERLQPTSNVAVASLPKPELIRTALAGLPKREEPFFSSQGNEGGASGSLGNKASENEAGNDEQKWRRRSRRERKKKKQKRFSFVVFFFFPFLSRSLRSLSLSLSLFSPPFFCFSLSLQPDSQAASGTRNLRSYVPTNPEDTKPGQSKKRVGVFLCWLAFLSLLLFNFCSKDRYFFFFPLSLSKT